MTQPEEVIAVAGKFGHTTEKLSAKDYETLYKQKEIRLEREKFINLETSTTVNKDGYGSKYKPLFNKILKTYDGEDKLENELDAQTEYNRFYDIFDKKSIYAATSLGETDIASSLFDSTKEIVKELPFVNQNLL